MAADAPEDDSWNWDRPTRLRIVLIRHAESANNVFAAMGPEMYKANRMPDPPLSPRGLEQV